MWLVDGVETLAGALTVMTHCTGSGAAHTFELCWQLHGKHHTALKARCCPWCTHWLAVSICLAAALCHNQCCSEIAMFPAS